MKPTPCEHDVEHCMCCGCVDKRGRIIDNMKPTPEEKCVEKIIMEDWKKHPHMKLSPVEGCTCVCCSPSPAEKIMCNQCNGWGYYISKDGTGPHTSPEARVDLEKEARELISGFLSDGGIIDYTYMKSIGGSLQKRIAKALSAAFEKGREAR